MAATIPKNKKGDIDLTELSMDAVHLDLLIAPPTPGLRREGRRGVEKGNPMPSSH